MKYAGVLFDGIRETVRIPLLGLYLIRSIEYASVAISDGVILIDFGAGMDLVML